MHTVYIFFVTGFRSLLYHVCIESGSVPDLHSYFVLKVVIFVINTKNEYK